MERTVKEIPYNSFGKILLAAGKEYPESLGGNCVFQLRRLIGIMAMKGIDPGKVQYMTAKERPHWVALLASQERKILLDPFLAPKSPFDVTDLLVEQRPGEFPLYPAIEGMEAKAKVIPISPEKFVIELHSLSTRRKLRKMLTYTYDLKNLGSELPCDDYQYLAGLTQTQIHMSVVVDDNCLIKLYLDPQRGEMNIINIGHEKASRIKNRAGYDKILAILLAKLGLTEQELFNTMEEARGIYLKIQAEKGS